MIILEEAQRRLVLIIIVCMDEKNGMIFNGRRQSQDQEVIKKMLEYAKGKPLWINDYSAQLFREDQQKQIKITENFFDLDEDDICFIENIRLDRCHEKVKKVIVFRWERVYTADVYFNFKLDNFCLASTEILKGSSHKEILIETYERF